MAETLNVVVCSVLVAVEELLEEEPVRKDEDIIKEFLRLFCTDLFFSERRKAVPVLICRTFGVIFVFRWRHLNNLL